MKTYLSIVENILINSGYSIQKVDDVWKLFENNVDSGKEVMQNRRKGELLAEACKQLGI